MFDFLIRLLVKYTAIRNSFPHRYWGCISLKRYQHSPLKNVLTKPFIHNLQSNMRKRSQKFFTDGFSNDSSSASQNMYFACWGIYDIDPFNNSFSFCRNPHMYSIFKCFTLCSNTVGSGSKRHSLFWLKHLGQWFWTFFVPPPIVATYYNPTTPI